MSSTSETGHYRNIANFNQVTQFCIGYGPTYNPSNPDLSTINLTSFHTTVLGLHNAIPVAQQPYIQAVNLRQERFDQLPAYATRIVGALAASSGVTSELVADAKTILRKIRGTRAKPVSPDSTTSISVSQRSYDLLCDHFNELVALVAAVPAYNPNEVDIQITNLNIAKAALLSANQSVATAHVGLSNARLARNTALYIGPSCLIQRAKAIKLYVKSIFGAASPQYKQISGISFREYKY